MSPAWQLMTAHVASLKSWAVRLVWIAGWNSCLRSARQPGPSAAYRFFYLSAFRRRPSSLRKSKKRSMRTNIAWWLSAEGSGTRTEKRLAPINRASILLAHPVLAGAAEKAQANRSRKLETKDPDGPARLRATRRRTLCQSDRFETNAFACGEAAVRAAIADQSGYMVKIVRGAQSNGSVKWRHRAATASARSPTSNISSRATGSARTDYLPNEKFVEYARPLIEGEVRAPVEAGLPKYVELESSKAEKKPSAAKLLRPPALGIRLKRFVIGLPARNIVS